jgi:hypothetical protein
MKLGMRAAAISIAWATLGACGGGGGGGGGAVATPGPSAIEVPMTSFPAIAGNQTAVMEGTSLGVSGSSTTPGGVTTIASSTLSSPDSATVKFTFDNDRTLSAITINTTAQGSFVFDRNVAGHSVSCSGSGACFGENPNAKAAFIDPFVAGWNYQSFGVWGTNLGPAPWMIGVVSTGSPTIGNAMPTTGSAVFNGAAVGYYFDPTGTPYATAANMSATVNFGPRSIQFSTSQTMLQNINTDVRTAANNLNLEGTMHFGAGASRFGGSLQTGNQELMGFGDGRFYGPAAEEIGGVYWLQGPAVSRMFGGFGGKR